MTVGLIGLGRMGQGIAARLLAAGIGIIGFDKSNPVLDFKTTGQFELVKTIEEVALKSRIIWLMVPAGKIVDDVIDSLIPHLRKDDIVIDGGNSFYKDSIRRYKQLIEHSVYFIDCGTSGGLHGKEIGYCLMIGGDKEPYSHCERLFKAIASPNGYSLLGPSGSGHYVKMVHNGIEYGLLQAYAEGFHVLKDGHYKNLDLEEISELWQHGSIIRSWILELAHKVFTQEQEIDDIYGAIAESGTGLWTVEEAQDHKITVDVIKTALAVRAESRKTGGNYATKLVSLLRHEFGGHPVTHISEIVQKKEEKNET